VEISCIKEILFGLGGIFLLVKGCINKRIHPAITELVLLTINKALFQKKQLTKQYDRISLSSSSFFIVVIESAMAELGRLLIYEASRDWLVS